MNYSPAVFVTYKDGVSEDLSVVETMMGEMLDESPERLVRQLREIEAWNAWLTKVLSDANAFLDVAESHALPPRSKEYSDLDRTTAQKAAVVEQRAFRDRLDGLATSMNSRLMLGMRLVNHHDNERRGLGAKTGE